MTTTISPNEALSRWFTTGTLQPEAADSLRWLLVHPDCPRPDETGATVPMPPEARARFGLKPHCSAALVWEACGIPEWAGFSYAAAVAVDQFEGGTARLDALLEGFTPPDGSEDDGEDYSD